MAATLTGMMALKHQAYWHGIETATHGWALINLFPPRHRANQIGWRDFWYGIGLAASASN